MASSKGGPKLIDISGESTLLVDRMRKPLQQALEGRRRFYAVRVETVGRVGDVLVSITGSKGRVPLVFDTEELEPGYVSRVIQDAVDKFDF